MTGRSLDARLERAWYPTPGVPARPHSLLRAAAWPYGLCVAARNRLFDRGTLASRRLPVPCIGVGNLTVGGTGKTPLVAWLVEALLERGVRPGILSRGYGGRVRAPERVPPGGTSREAARFGDEPALLAARYADVPVVVGRDRFEAGMHAVRECGAQVVVADDAFQHRKLARDLNIAVVDASRGMGNGLLLPAGPLREPIGGLARADVVVLNRIGQAAAGAFGQGTGAEALRRLVARVAPRADLAEADLAFAGWVDARTGRAAELPSGGGIYAFCGLANPDSFRRSLEALGRRLAGWTVFRDHHAYGERDLADLARRAASSGAVAAVTTAKDAVRIPAWPGPLPLYRAEVKLVMIQGRERLWNDLEILAAGGRA